ncbi:hypothetical protein Lser_V15G45813 [Lactuca serriola]
MSLINPNQRVSRGTQEYYYGSSNSNIPHNEKLNKVEALKHYNFSLAFENSNDEDYVTEKYFQSPVILGSIPVVYGALNIQDFAPSRDSILHIKDLKDVESVANTMKRLSENHTVYSELLRKVET